MKVVSDSLAWQSIRGALGGTDIFRCHENVFCVYKIHVYGRFFWFMVYTKLFRQNAHDMLNTRDVYQMIQIRSDTHL